MGNSPIQKPSNFGSIRMLDVLVSMLTESAFFAVDAKKSYTRTSHGENLLKCWLGFPSIPTVLRDSCLTQYPGIPASNDENSRICFLN